MNPSSPFIMTTETFVTQKTGWNPRMITNHCTIQYMFIYSATSYFVFHFVKVSFSQSNKACTLLNLLPLSHGLIIQVVYVISFYSRTVGKKFNITFFYQRQKFERDPQASRLYVYVKPNKTNSCCYTLRQTNLCIFFSTWTFSHLATIPIVPHFLL